MKRPNAAIPATSIAHRPSHPGRLLAEEMEARGLNANALSVMLHVPRNRLAAIMAERRAITPDTALRLERCLGVRAYLWLSLQGAYDLAMAEQELAPAIRKEITPLPPVGHAA
jgi:addiction module HigA family antidote